MRKSHLSPEEREDLLQSLVTHPGFYILKEEMDVIVDRIRDGIHGCSLSNDPNADGLKLLAERYKLEGAKGLVNALMVRVEQAKPKGDKR